MTKKNNFKVNFLIVGAQKCGTTALSNFLSQHNEICIPPCKEVHLFDSPEFDNRWDEEEINDRYRNKFINYSGENIIGEATPIYMYLPIVAKRIHRYNSDMKLIFLLRNPVDRAISHYSMAINRKEESRSFAEAVLLERYRLWKAKNNYSFSSPIRSQSYISRGFYSKQIEKMLELFSAKQMLFVKTEDLVSNHELTIKKIYEFLGIKETNFIPKQEKIFETKKRPEIPQKMIEKLERKFLKEIQILEDLLGWNLDDWKRT